MNRIYLSELSCRKGRESYTVSMRPEHGERVSMQTDGNLGQIMSGISVLVKAIHRMHGGPRLEEPTILRGTVNLSLFRIEPLSTWPLRWGLTMEANGHRYEATVEPDLELVLLAFQGAMKFFGFKSGLTTFDGEVIRNRDRAGEVGLLTREDFHA